MLLPLRARAGMLDFITKPYPGSRFNDQCNVSNMSAFITFLLGYCIYQAERSIKAYIHCESLCRTGHCAHHLHTTIGGVGGGGGGGGGHGADVGGHARIINGHGIATPYFFRHVIDVGVIVALLFLKACLVLTSSFTLKNVQDFLMGK